MDAQEQAPPSGETSGGQPLPIKILSIKHYTSLPEPNRPSYLVEGLVPAEGKIMLVAPAKAGKSTLALQLANAVGSGLPFLGRDTTKSKVLYLQFDNVETTWRDMLKRGQEEDLTFENVDMVDPTTLPNPSKFDITLRFWQEWMRQALKLCDPALIVLDVFRKFHKKDENRSNEMTEVHNALTSCATGRSLFILHHSVKFRVDDEHGPPDVAFAGRGSGVIAGDVDGTWFLYKNTMLVESRMDENQTFHLKRTPNGFWLTAEQQQQEKLVTIQAFLAAHPGMSHNQLSKLAPTEIGMSRMTFYRYLRRL